MEKKEADRLLKQAVPPTGISGSILRSLLEMEGMDGREITMAVARAFDSGVVRLGASMWIYPNEAQP